MSVLGQEATVMQNPALGALLLWRFSKSHADSHPQKFGAQLPLAFLVLPLVWHPATAEPIEGTLVTSGLRKYAAKFTESDGARDILLGVNDRVMRMRAKSHAALRAALATGLVTLTADARLMPKLLANEPGSNRAVLAMTGNAEKLGVWFAALTTHEISLILHVSL